MNFTRVHIIIIILSTAVFQPCHTLAQNDSGRNLISNPSFEKYRRCPDKINPVGVLKIVNAWFQPTSGSADYYNVCGSVECFVPNNKLGIQQPRTGDGYCGIYCSKDNYREYLQTQLEQPLKAGHRYRLSFFVSLSEYSTGGVATIGGLLSKERLSDTTRAILMKKTVRPITSRISQTTSVYYQPQVMNSADRPLMDTQGWMEITGDFVAEGGETFLTIGNFLSAASSGYTDDTLLLTYLLPGSYYYIDDVKLYCLDCDDDYNDEPIAKTDTTYKVGATFVLNNIFFDTDKSNLLQQSYQELQYLIAILESHPKMKIEISGHTDSQGSDLHNQQLSENRAKEVVAYLMENGIEEKRLKFKGYGKTQPIATNTTEEGRQKNRRVEFKILDL